MKTQQRTLREAQDRFRALLQDRNTPERQWQKLFADCPFIFSSSLPVRIHEDDIHPLARPGRAEPDFIFFPKQPSPLSTFGVIELKRADTRLIRIPRRNVLSLSSNATDAIAQAQKYAMEFEAKMIIRSDELLVIGNAMHVFVIAGMSDEIAGRVNNDILRAQFANLLPSNCRIIPFDTLLAAFESRITPAVHLLNTWLPQSCATLSRFYSEIETAYQGYAGYNLDDEIYDFWVRLEKEFIWMLGPNASYKKAISPRSYFEIADSKLSQDGRKPLAMEAPNPSMFALEVCSFVRNVVQRTKEFGIEPTLSDDLKTLWQHTGAYASD